MSLLTEQLQSFIYDLDALIDRGCADDELWELRQRISEFQFQQDAIEIHHATEKYEKALTCVSQAKASVTHCIEDLSHTAEAIEKISKCVTAIRKLFD